MKKIYFVSFALAFFTTACTKHGNDIAQPESTEKTTISFVAPTEGGVYSINDSVSIQAICIAPATIHGCDIIITKAGDTTTLFSKHVHNHNDTVNVQQKWKGSFTMATNLEVMVKAVLDHEGNYYSKKVSFKIQ